MTASDFKWSWERSLTKATDQGRANDVLGWIKGANELTQGGTEGLVGVTAVDDRTLSIELERARIDFLDQLADPVAAVLKRENVEQWGHEWENGAGALTLLSQTPVNAFKGSGLPVGAGPFHITEYNPADPALRCVIKRNDHYWGAPAKLDGVIFIEDVWPTDGFEDPTIAYDERAYIERRIDYLFVSSETADEIRQRDSDLHGELVYQESLPYSQFIVFNPDLPPLSDVNFRQAVVSASDLEAVFEPYPIEWEPRIVHPAVTQGTSARSNIKFDSDLANNKLDRSMYSSDFNDFDVTFYSTSSGFNDDRYAILLDSWRNAINFDVKHNYAVASSLKTLAESGLLHMVAVEITPPIPNPIAILRAMVEPFSNSEETSTITQLRKMIDSAIATEDKVARNRMFEEIEQRVLDEAIALPLLLSWGGYEILVQPWVRDFDIPMFPGSVFHDVWFEGDVPERSLD